MTTRHHEPASPQVVLYALSTCSHCKAVRQLLHQLGIVYDEIVVNLLAGEAREQTLAEIRRHNSRVAFPTTVIDGEAVVGNKPQAIQSRLGEPKKGD